MSITPVSHQTQIKKSNHTDNSPKTVLPELPDNFVKNIFNILGKENGKKMRVVCKRWSQLLHKKVEKNEIISKFSVFSSQNSEFINISLDYTYLYIRKEPSYQPLSLALQYNF